jgi:predicted small lipoprotein YifL
MRMRRLIPLILVATLLAACGTKGALYIPTAEQRAATDSKQKR